MSFHGQHEEKGSAQRLQPAHQAARQRAQLSRQRGVAMARLAAELRKRFAQVLETVKDPITEVHAPVKLIHTFHSEADLEPWELVLDRTYGGSSEASLSMGPDGYGVFEGVISDDLGASQVLKRSGFCGIRYTGRPEDTMLGYYDAFLLRVKADDRMYLLNAGTTAAWVDGLYQSAFQRPAKAPPNEWAQASTTCNLHHSLISRDLPLRDCWFGQLTLPFDKFNQTHEGFMLEQQHTMDTRHASTQAIPRTA